jgi:hypothetical protein
VIALALALLGVMGSVVVILIAVARMAGGGR